VISKDQITEYSVTQTVDIPRKRLIARLVHLQPNKMYRAQVFSVKTISDNLIRSKKASVTFETKPQVVKGKIMNLWYFYLNFLRTL